MFDRARSSAIAGVIVVLLVFAPGCGGGDSSARSSSTASGSVPTSIAAVAAVPFTAELASDPPAGATSVKLVDLKFDPSALTGTTGGVVMFLQNLESPCTADLDESLCRARDHGMWVVGADGQTVAKALVLHPGQAETFTVTLGAGSYRLVCPLPTHATQGMTGTLTVAA